MALELRVVSGVHAGASVALPVEGGVWTLGQAAHCDVILRDAPFAEASLQGDSTGWRLEREGVQVDWPAGAGVRVGDLALVMVEAHAPWQSEPTLGWVLDESSSKPKTVESIETPNELIDSEGSLDMPPPTPMPDDKLAPNLRPARTGRALAAAMVLGLGIWGMVAWVIPPMLNLGSSGDPASVARAASAAASAPVETVDMAMLRAEVQKAVDALQVAGSVRTLPYAAGKVQLSGVVDSDETAEAVVRAASKVTASLKMSLLSQAEFALRLQGLKSALPEELTLRALPWGKVEVSGTVPDQATKENVQSLLLEELPMAVAVDMKVLTTQERQAQEARTAAASTPKLPPVAAVISGPRPYLVLADGRKILPGGVVGQLRLAGIEPQAVVFENEAGVQYRMAR